MIHAEFRCATEKEPFPFQGQFAFQLPEIVRISTGLGRRKRPSSVGFGDDNTPQRKTKKKFLDGFTFRWAAKKPTIGIPIPNKRPY